MNLLRRHLRSAKMASNFADTAFHSQIMTPIINRMDKQWPLSHGMAGRHLLAFICGHNDL